MGGEEDVGMRRVCEWEEYSSSAVVRPCVLLSLEIEVLIWCIAIRHGSCNATWFPMSNFQQMGCIRSQSQSWLHSLSATTCCQQGCYSSGKQLSLVLFADYQQWTRSAGKHWSGNDNLEVWRVTTAFVLKQKWRGIFSFFWWKIITLIISLSVPSLSYSAITNPHHPHPSTYIYPTPLFQQQSTIPIIQ